MTCPFILVDRPCPFILGPTLYEFLDLDLNHKNGTVGLDLCITVIHFSLTMKTATVRDLRNHFPRVALWIAQGEPVEITKSGKPFARLLPALPERTRRFKMPDIMARLNQTFGDSTYDETDIARGLAASRGDLW